MNNMIVYLVIHSALTTYSPAIWCKIVYFRDKSTEFGTEVVFHELINFSYGTSRNSAKIYEIGMLLHSCVVKDFLNIVNIPLKFCEI